jgi:N6-adenosine-specific RNA methylase IME4
MGFLEIFRTSFGGRGPSANTDRFRSDDMRYGTFSYGLLSSGDSNNNIGTIQPRHAACWWSKKITQGFLRREKSILAGMASCILYQNADQTATLLDLPRSLELAQGSQGEVQSNRIISCTPVEQPFANTNEPKSAKALANFSPVSFQALLLQRHIQLALEEVKSAHTGQWCLPRVVEENTDLQDFDGRKHARDTTEEDIVRSSSGEPIFKKHAVADHCLLSYGIVYHNPETITKHHSRGLEYIPPLSTFIQGNIKTTCKTFMAAAPKFNLVIMDPPWPNKSARRKKSYSISYDTDEISSLLSSIPLTNHLAEDALVGVWVTNKGAFHDLLLAPCGLFEQWGLQLIEEWIWLKVTSSGDPISAIDSLWRKPYERLLLGKKKPPNIERVDVKRRILIGVPDLHSRKPSLQILFEPMLPAKYEALEIFARNLTAGWWSWGNEVLKFQSGEHWVNSENETLNP